MTHSSYKDFWLYIFSPVIKSLLIYLNTNRLPEGWFYTTKFQVLGNGFQLIIDTNLLSIYRSITSEPVSSIIPIISWDQGKFCATQSSSIILMSPLAIAQWVILLKRHFFPPVIHRKKTLPFHLSLYGRNFQKDILKALKRQKSVLPEWLFL